MMALAHCSGQTLLQGTTQPKVQLGKRFSKFVFIFVKGERYRTSRQGMDNSLVWLQKGIVQMLIKLFEVPGMFILSCFQEFFGGDVIGHHQWKSAALDSLQMTI